MRQDGQETPLCELLRLIPKDACLNFDDPEVKNCSHHSPIGNFAHQAADRIAALEAEVVKLQAQLAKARSDALEEAAKIVIETASWSGATPEIIQAIRAAKEKP